MDNEDDGTELQEKLYSLLSKLQKMSGDIPAQYQQRIPHDVLSQLAASLTQGQIVEIVRMLTEVQQATEKHLFQQRLQFISQQKTEKQELVKQTKTQTELAALEMRQKEELRQHDMKLITQLDQKVSDQQVTLQRAGVPGFYVTNNPTEIRVQMYILDFILKIGDHQTWSF